METQPGWERNKAKTRVSLARAAARLFRENGYDATTVDDIARAAGTSRRTFFRYFGTKEEVLFLGIPQILEDVESALAAPGSGQTRWSQVRAAISESVERMAVPGDELEQVSITSWLHEPAVSRRFAEYSGQLEGIVANALADGREADPATDLRTQLQARVVTAAYMSAFAIYIETGRDLSEVLAEAFDLVERGIVQLD